MIKLEKEITLTGEGYQGSPRLLCQVKRNDSVAIYSRADKNKSPDKPYCYEVFRIPIVKAGTKWPNGSTEPADRESYPGASMFGKSAWCIKSKASAENKYQELNRLNEEKIKDLEIEKSAACEGAFTTAEYAIQNGLTYTEARCFILDSCELVGKRSMGQGKPSNLYKIKKP